MATATKQTQPATATTPIGPPEEKFWVKYSRHHELPISGLTSLAWHTMAIVTMVVVAWAVANGTRDDMPIETIEFGTGGAPGGTNGTGQDPNHGDGGPLVEAASASELPPDVQKLTDQLADIKDLQITPKDLIDDVNLDSDRELLKKMTDRGTKALQQLSKLDKEMRKALMGQPGTGTPGAGGGPGGKGAGNGNGNVPGPGASNARTKRKLRWTITFNTQSGADYLRQVHILGAILAMRTPDGELKCVKDLMRRPVQLETEDLQKLNRIFWIDDRRDSVEQLARAMGLGFVPDRIYALFPYEFEKALLKKELEFRNKKEDEILETRFQILLRGDSGYEIVVLDQRYF
jgi:hypothetical protein